MKKLIAIILTVIMAASVIGVQAIAPDVQDTSYEQAVDLAVAFGIMENRANNRFEPESAVTRAEAAKAAAVLSGFYDKAEVDLLAYFHDVTEETYGFAEINFLAKLGIVRGGSDGNFAPERALTAPEAAKFMSAVLGYDYMAENKGGYPGGYLAVAAQNRMFHNVTLDDGTVKRGDFAKIIENCLSLKPVLQYIANNKVQMQELNETLLEHVFQVKKTTAQVTDRDYSALYHENNRGNAWIVADEQVYEVTDPTLNIPLGYCVTLYYKQDADRRECVYAQLPKNKNDVTCIYAQDIVSADKTKIVYREDSDSDDTKTIDLNYSFAFVYNGTAKPEYTDEDFRPDSGKVELIDCNNDGKYDAVIVSSYVNYFVKSISLYDEMVYDSYRMQPLKLDSKDKRVTVERAGKEATVADIKPNDVLAVASDAEKLVDVATASGTTKVRMVDNDKSKNIHIIICTQAVTGRVTAVDSGNHCFEVGGKYYNLAKSFPYGLGTAQSGDISVGDQGVFHFDMNLNLAGFTIVTAMGKQYGFLISAEPGKGLSTSGKFKLITTNGKELVLDGADKMKIDHGGKTYEPREIIEKMCDASGKIRQELIEYQLNDDGQLTEVNYAVDSTGTGYDKEQFSLDYENKEALYDSTYLYFDRKFAVNRDDYTIFFVNQGADGRYQAEDVKTGLYSSLSHDIRYDLKGYNADEVGRGTLLVINKKSAETVDQKKSPIAMVDKVFKSLDKEGDTVYSCYCYVNGQYQKLVFSSDAKKSGYEDGYYKKYKYVDKITSPADFKRGDVFQYDTNTGGEISVYAPLFLPRFDHDAESLEMNTKHNKAYHTILGDTLYANDQFIRIRFYNGVTDETETQMVSIRSRKVVMYDKENDKLSVIDPGDIRTEGQALHAANAARLFFKMYQGEVTGFLIVQ